MRVLSFAGLFALMLCFSCATDASPDEGADDNQRATATNKPAQCPTGVFPTQWNNGTNCATEPSIQVHKYNEDTFILRQSLCTSFEGPFLYLLFGENKVLLEDTGAGGIQIRAKVDEVINQWLKDHNKQSIELVVVNSHAHGDHVAGNPQFANRPNTKVVGIGVNAIKAFFGMTTFPTEIVTFDLGGRVLDIFGIPGHQGADIAIYDRKFGLLTTGDTLYPGRLFINSFSDYQLSINRLVTFTKATKKRPVCAVLGAHIEMTSSPGIDFAFGATKHPNEHSLPLERKHLLELQAGVKKMGTTPIQEAHDDFIIFPL